MKSYISAVNYFLPKNIVKTKDLLKEVKPEKFGISENFIHRVIGVEEIRHSKYSLPPSQLAILASKELFKCSHFGPSDIDAVIFCGIERDYIEPSTAHIVQHTLGISKAECKDVSNACMGFMSGLRDADMMIRCGEAENILVCTGESPSRWKSKFIDSLAKEKDPFIFRRKIGGLTAGDAGAAVVVSRSLNNSGFDVMNFESYGHLASLCYYYIDENGNPDGKMLMKEISAEMINAHQNLLPKTKAKMINVPEIACFITHQVGKKPWLEFSKIMDINSDLMTKTFDKLGNVTSATFAINYAQALESGRICKGDFVFCAMAGSGLTICQIGLTV